MSLNSTFALRCLILAVVVSNLVSASPVVDIISNSIPELPPSKPKPRPSSSTLPRRPLKPDVHLIEHRLGDIVPVNLHRPCDVLQEDVDDVDYNDPGSISRLEIEFGRKEDEEETAAVDLDQWLTHQVLDHNETKQRPLTGRERLGFDYVHAIILKTHQLQGLATNLVRKSLIEECHSLPYRPLVHFPKDITKSDLVATLGQVYRTLTNQTSHLYFIWARQRNQTRLRSSLICADHLTVAPVAGKLTIIGRKEKKAHAAKLSGHFGSMSDSLRSLMCHFQRTFLLFGMPVPADAIVDQVLDHKILSSTLCVRQSLLDCFVMRNAIATFGEIETFLREHSHRMLNFRQEAATR